MVKGYDAADCYSVAMVDILYSVVLSTPQMKRVIA